MVEGLVAYADTIVVSEILFIGQQIWEITICKKKNVLLVCVYFQYSTMSIFNPFTHKPAI